MAVDFQYNIFSMESSISVAIGKLIDSYEHTLDTPGMPSIHPPMGIMVPFVRSDEGSRDGRSDWNPHEKFETHFI